MKIDYTKTDALIRNFDLITIEAEYKRAVLLLRDSFANFDAIENIYKLYFNCEYSPLSSVLTRHTVEYHIKDLTQKAWYQVIEKMQIRDFLSQKKREEIDRMVSENRMPEFTAMNISHFITDAAQNINTIVQDLAVSVWNFIKPHRTDYKTNCKDIPNKAVLKYIFTNFPTYSFDYNKWASLKDLDNIFHLLDGKGVVKYPGGICTAINGTKERFAETEYFKLKWYGNGNLHVEFKRMDLVQKLSVLATKNNLAR